MTCDTDITCPSPENYAAIAKALHATAQQTEDRIYCLESLVLASLNRPTAISLQNADVESYSDGLHYNVFSSWNSPPYVPVFVNSPMVVDSDFFYDPGMYQVGMYVSPYTVGAANVNTARIVGIHVINPVTGVIADRIESTTFETNVANVGNESCVEGVLRIEAGQRVNFTFFHSNTSSNMRFNAGGLAWITKISDLNVTRVVV